MGSTMSPGYLHSCMMSRCKEYRKDRAVYQREYLRRVVKTCMVDEEKIHKPPMAPGTPFCRNYVNIDGEPFLMTIPYEGIWRDIEKAAFKTRPTISKEVNFALLREHHPVLNTLQLDSSLWQLFLSASDSSVVCTLNKASTYGIGRMVEYKQGDLPVKKSEYGFRPMLIPLTKDHLPDLSFGKDNPNGSIIYGGTFRVNGKVCGQDEKILNLTAKDDFLISDTLDNDKPLQWICWGGVLYGTRNLFHMTIQVMYERGLFFG